MLITHDGDEKVLFFSGSVQTQSPRIDFDQPFIGILYFGTIFDKFDNF